ncbi:VP2 [Halogeometricum pleomorphic virus 1]|uniref:VP2 n=1 Tax=Halogeometricum pleomorphic virus 1 TaxID=1156722 RepID=H9ABQ3_9VIRU|nr:VP2 [Halogeometricum pleomorphic virus 1]AFD04023.1 VP2 [Halogeometricum pleomorphic virus 1]
MSKMTIDPEDVASTVATFIGTSSMAGIAQWSLFDVSLSDQAFQLAGNSVTLATVLTAVALAAIVFTNDNGSIDELHAKAKKLDNYYYYSIVGSVALLVGWVFVGDVSSFITSSDLWGVGYVAVSMVAHFALGWML